MGKLVDFLESGNHAEKLKYQLLYQFNWELHSSKPKQIVPVILHQNGQPPLGLLVVEVDPKHLGSSLDLSLQDIDFPVKGGRDSPSLNIGDLQRVYEGRLIPPIHLEYLSE